MTSVESIFGYPITLRSKEECISQIVRWLINGEKGKYFVCANPHSLEEAMSDPLFDCAIKNSDLVIPDGVGVVVASKILGGNIKSRITGSDIFLDLSNELNRRGAFSYFFLGSTEETLIIMKNKLNMDFPNIRLAGTFSPPFKMEFNEEDNRLMINRINNAKPDVLWIGMTAPKQEKWIYQHKNELTVKFIGPIGAVFDFYTGKVKRSHPFSQKLGLEWLPRFIREPRRLWRRNLVSSPKFLLRVLNLKLKGV